MDILVTALKRKINEYDGVVIYGCGKVAKETYNVLFKCGVEPEFCVVSKKNGTDLFADIMPVYEFTARAQFIKEHNILVIIGVSSLYAKEIEDEIQNNHINSYVLITDFERNALYRQMTCQECLEEIAQWYVDSHNHDITGMSKFDVQERLNYQIKQERHKNKVIFVMGALTPRVLKIAEALLKKGYQIKIMASETAVMQDFCIAGLREIKLTYEQYASLEELMYRIIDERAEVVHLFTNLTHSWIDRILIKMKQLFPPIIYDEFDIYNLCYEGVLQELLDNERFCLEHADGICNRGYEIDYLIDNGFKIEGKVLQFSDFCSCEQIQRVERKGENDSLSVCYVGGIFSKKESSDWVSNFFEYARRCEENQCHFHVYPFTWDEERFADYINLERENAFFHFHKPITFNQLKYEISKYDYGTFPMKQIYLDKGLTLSEGLSFTAYRKEELLYATGNKYFDYLDAGLPIIAACPQKLMNFLETKGVVLKWTVEKCDFDELKRRKKEFKDRVKQEHYGLQMVQHIEELIDLYDSVVKERLEH